MFVPYHRWLLFYVLGWGPAFYRTDMNRWMFHFVPISGHNHSNFPTSFFFVFWSWRAQEIDTAPPIQSRMYQELSIMGVWWWRLKPPDSTTICCYYLQPPAENWWFCFGFVQVVFSLHSVLERMGWLGWDSVIWLTGIQQQFIENMFRMGWNVYDLIYVVYNMYTRSIDNFLNDMYYNLYRLQHAVFYAVDVFTCLTTEYKFGMNWNQQPDVTEKSCAVLWLIPTCVLTLCGRNHGNLSHFFYEWKLSYGKHPA